MSGMHMSGLVRSNFDLMDSFKKISRRDPAGSWEVVRMSELRAGDTFMTDGLDGPSPVYMALQDPVLNRDGVWEIAARCECNP